MVYTKEVTNYISSVNQVFDEISLKEFVPLGPIYGTMDFHSACDNLIRMRMANYWVNPANAAIDPAKRRESSVANVLAFDKAGFLFEPWTLSQEQRSALHCVQKILADAVKGFRFDPTLLRMPSGESNISSRGDVSVYAKLKDVSQWCVTADSFDLACTVVYNSPGLKRAARHHIGVLSNEERSRLYSAFSDYSDVGYRVFRECFLQVVTIVEGSRIETVPKDNDVDRVISCEPFLNMIVQSVIEEGIRAVIRTKFGYDLDTLADEHKALVVDTSFATIDLKNASNSNWLSVIDYLYPERFRRFLHASRSPSGTFNGQSHDWTMVSPMGNGFTFGLMTLTLLAIGKSITSDVSVFGDDILIKQPHAGSMIDLCKLCGFEVNDKKTFISGAFRETCGGFSSHGQRITSFKFNRATDVVTANVLVNKVYILMKMNPLIHWLRLLWRRLLKLVPALFLEFRDISSPEGRFVVVNNDNLLLRLRRACASYKKFRTTWLSSRKVKLFAHQNRYAIEQLSPVCYATHSTIPYKWKRAPVHNIKGVLISFYLFNGRVSTPTVRSSSARVSYEVVVSSRWTANSSILADG